MQCNGGNPSQVVYMWLNVVVLVGGGTVLRVRFNWRHRDQRQQQVGVISLPRLEHVSVTFDSPSISCHNSIATTLLPAIELTIVDCGGGRGSGVGDVDNGCGWFLPKHFTQKT
eukprot:m.113010 g.113010  ORF g.113010 m.113010 type:complete len:113 (-) comp28236_c3_seq1:110-448(-)